MRRDIETADVIAWAALDRADVIQELSALSERLNRSGGLA
jgi:hypothetical protein